ncbi:MAG: hypothetical protein JJ992_05585, partial [Planctomycetes bacterium]|nr:hypothetical protein [Planctomycetota bacterium]
MQTPIGDQRIAYLWYDVGGQRVVSALRAKLLVGLNLLLGRPDAGVTILSARCGVSCDAAREALNDWLEAFVQAKGVSG